MPIKSNIEISIFSVCQDFALASQPASCPATRRASQPRPRCGPPSRRAPNDRRIPSWTVFRRSYTCSLPVCPFSGRLCIRNSRPRGIYSRSGRAFYRVGWLSVTGIWGLHTFSPRALAREALSMASAGAAGSVLLRQSRGKRPSRWRVITPGARRGTDTPGRVRPSHCSGAAGANSNHSC